MSLVVILWRLRIGCIWRDLSLQFGPWHPSL
ncbi:TPA: hypothetical protein EYN23_15905 [Candidatus Poribacteria bacterium]|nr:hypothetical protein [Candidatus Poribacteria bacterium]